VLLHVQVFSLKTIILPKVGLRSHLEYLCWPQHNPTPFLLFPFPTCFIRYATTCVGTTLLNAFLIKLDVPRGIAFWGTLYGFGVVNFFLLRQLMKSDSDDSTGSTDGDDALKNVKNGGSTCLSRYRRPFLFFGNHKLLQVVKTTGRRVDV